MYEVLRKWEHPIAHAGRCATSTEVCNLIEFIHRSAGFRQNRAAAGDKAPCIEFTTVLDCNGAVIRHFDVSIITNGTSLLATGSGKIPAAQADGTIDGNGRAFAHRQRPERLRRGSRPNRRRSIRIQCPCLIERDQKCNSRRNGISTADRAIRSQRNLGLAVCPCVSNRFIQVCKPLTASLKKRQRLAHKLRRNGAVTFDIQGGGCRSRDAFACGHIIPAQELITLRRGRLQLIGGHGALGVGVHLGDSLPVHGIGAVLGGLEGHGGAHIGHQLHVGHGDLGVGAGAAGFDLYLNLAAGFKLLAEAAVCDNGFSADLNGAAVLLDGISKGQCSLCSLVVFDGQCGIIGCIAAGSTSRYD